MYRIKITRDGDVLKVRRGYSDVFAGTVGVDPTRANGWVAQEPPPAPGWRPRLFRGATRAAAVKAMLTAEVPQANHRD